MSSRKTQHASVRAAREEDVERLVEIARRAWLSAFAQTAPFSLIDHWVRADRETAWYRSYWHEMLVAVVDGLPVGLVQPREDEINGLWIDPDYHRRGYGALLLRSGEDVIRAYGHDRAWLTCSTFNAPAMRFYQAQGYAEVRRYREVLPCGLDEESAVLERRLQ